MSEIDSKTVLRCAELARLELSEEEVEEFTPQIDKILEFAKQLSEVDTEGVEPMLFAVRQSNVFREDKVSPSLTQEEALSNASSAKDGFFLVPKVVDN